MEGASNGGICTRRERRFVVSLTNLRYWVSHEVPTCATAAAAATVVTPDK